MKKRYKNIIKDYAFAHKLKAFCIDVLGLDHNQCYGTEEEKNSLTKYRWADVHEDIRSKYPEAIAKSPFMTARQVMQVVGTDLMRKMFYDRIWIDSAFDEIAKEQQPKYHNRPYLIDSTDESLSHPEIAAILDCRFINEIKDTRQFCYEFGCDLITIRIKRPKKDGSKDQHQSERDLDSYTGFDHVINNDGTLEEYEQKIENLLDSLNI